MNCYIARHSKRIETGEKPDMKGYSALVVYTQDMYGVPAYNTYYTYCDYVKKGKNAGSSCVYSSNEGNKSVTQIRVDIYGNESVIYENYEVLSSSWYDGYKFYGDVRYLDGSKAPTDDPLIIPAKFDCIICK